jgi:hypothetical protein
MKGDYDIAAVRYIHNKPPEHAVPLKERTPPP